MTYKRLHPLFAATVSFTLSTGLLASTAMAQDTAPITVNGDQTRTFAPDYFEQFAPLSALDMINRIPGFQLTGGNGRRGLGQGGANVLINGQRISGKSNPSDQIGRITAKNVVKIEIVDANSLNIPGLSGQVANITTKSTGMTGTWEWSPEWRENLEPRIAHGSITLSGEKGNLAYTAELQSNVQRNGHLGPEERRTATGDLFEIRDETAKYNNENPGASLNLTWTPKDQHVGNLNLEYYLFNANNNTLSILSQKGPGGATGQHIFSRAEDEWNAKIDGDYEFPAGDGMLKLIGYYRAEHSPTVSRFDAYSETAHVESTRFFQVADEGEAIARAEYSWSRGQGRDWQVGLEGAFNFLDIENQFIDVLVPANSDSMNTSRVDEKRAEANITHTRTISPKWDVQISAGSEYSQLSQGNLQREFFRPKGFISATYKPTDTLTIRPKIEREVGQLNFFDFISSVSLQDNLNTTGNPDLVPSQSWTGEIEFDKQWPDGHSFQARVYGEKISDLVDRIPLGVNGDAVGNIDSAEKYGIDFDATLKGDPWGLKGMELSLELDVRESSVADPVEGFSRRLNGDKKYYWSASFRHDIPDSNWAWGFYSDQFREAEVYRLNTVSEFRFEGPWAQVFVEHKDVLGMKVTGSLRNLFDASDDFRRDIYTDRRDIGVLDVTEERTRPFGMFFRLTVSGTF